jgi:hypothetical protein
VVEKKCEGKHIQLNAWTTPNLDAANQSTAVHVHPSLLEIPASAQVLFFLSIPRCPDCANAGSTSQNLFYVQSVEMGLQTVVVGHSIRMRSMPPSHSLLLLARSVRPAHLALIGKPVPLMLIGKPVPLTLTWIPIHLLPAMPIRLVLNRMPIRLEAIARVPLHTIRMSLAPKTICFSTVSIMWLVRSIL